MIGCVHQHRGNGLQDGNVVCLRQLRNLNVGRCAALMITAITVAVVIVAAGTAVFGHCMFTTRNMHLAGLRVVGSNGCRQRLQWRNSQGDGQPECGQDSKRKLHGRHNVRVYRHQYNMYESSAGLMVRHRWQVLVQNHPVNGLMRGFVVIIAGIQWVRWVIMCGYPAQKFCLGSLYVCTVSFTRV